jgi:hypothetical protein
MGNITYGAVVGKVEKNYTVVIYSCADDHGKCSNWKFASQVVSGTEISRMIKRGVQFSNVKISGGKIVGSPFSLDRLSDVSLVIIAEMYASDDKSCVKCLAYKAINPNGEVKIIKKMKLIEACKMAKSKGKVLVQNYAFDGERGVLRKGSEDQRIIAERIDRVKKVVPTKKVNYKEAKPDENKNKSKLDKLKEIYTTKQLVVIARTMKEGYSPKPMMNPAFTPEQMEEISRGIKGGVDVSSWAKVEISAELMRLYVIAQAIKGIDVTPFVNKDFKTWNLQLITEAAESGFDISKINDPTLKREEIEFEIEKMEGETFKKEYKTENYGKKIGMTDILTGDATQNYGDVSPEQMDSVCTATAKYLKSEYDKIPEFGKGKEVTNVKALMQSTPEIAKFSLKVAKFTEWVSKIASDSNSKEYIDVASKFFKSINEMDYVKHFMILRREGKAETPNYDIYCSKKILMDPASSDKLKKMVMEDLMGGTVDGWEDGEEDLFTKFAKQKMVEE